MMGEFHCPENWYRQPSGTANIQAFGLLSTLTLIRLGVGCSALVLYDGIAEDRRIHVRISSLPFTRGGNPVYRFASAIVTNTVATHNTPDTVHYLPHKFQHVCLLEGGFRGKRVTPPTPNV